MYSHRLHLLNVFQQLRFERKPYHACLSECKILILWAVVVV